MIQGTSAGHLLSQLGNGDSESAARTASKRAIRFYERNGFRPSGKIKDFFAMPLFEYVKILA